MKVHRNKRKRNREQAGATDQTDTQGRVRVGEAPHVLQQRPHECGGHANDDHAKPTSRRHSKCTSCGRLENCTVTRRGTHAPTSFPAKGVGTMEMGNSHQNTNWIGGGRGKGALHRDVGHPAHTRTKQPLFNSPGCVLRSSAVGWTGICTCHRRRNRTQQSTPTFPRPALSSACTKAGNKVRGR